MIRAISRTFRSSYPYPSAHSFAISLFQFQTKMIPSPIYLLPGIYFIQSILSATLVVFFGNVFPSAISFAVISFNINTPRYLYFLFHCFITSVFGNSIPTRICTLLLFSLIMPQILESEFHLHINANTVKNSHVTHPGHAASNHTEATSESCLLGRSSPDSYGAGALSV